MIAKSQSERISFQCKTHFRNYVMDDIFRKIRKQINSQFCVTMHRKKRSDFCHDEIYPLKRKMRKT